MFRLSKYGVCAYIHLWACLLQSSDAPPHLYPCNLFYFCFIYSILYILHTLIFKNNKFTLGLTVQNHSEILSKFAWTLASLQLSCFASNQIARTRTCLHSLCIHSHLRSSNQIHSHTSDIPFTLTHPHSSYTPQTLEGSTLLSHILDHLFYGVLFGLIQTL